MIALFGNAVAVLIVVLTNRAAISREESRQTHESRRWQREDAWRIGEVQRGYYVDYYAELRAASMAVHDAGYKIGPPLDFGWQLPAYEALMRLRVFATSSTFAAADKVYDALWAWGDSGRGGYVTEEEEHFDAALEGYLRAVRTDIGVADHRTEGLASSK
jgi:hypothetical protein